jgi:FtsZ-interacting cell division protein ZipA
MNWIVIVGVAVLVVVLVALAWPSRKDREKAKADKKKTADLSEWQRRLWARGEEVIAAHHAARGAEVGPARERMLRYLDEVDAGVREVEKAGASERQVLMAKLAAEEIRGFVDDALARHPEGQQT